MSKAIRSAAIVLLAGAALAGTARAQSAEDLQIKRRSSFDNPAGLRDPFVPIGWQPQAGVVTGTGNTARTTESYIVPAAFTVTSISLDRLPLAVINGKAYGEGDLLPFSAGGERVQLQVAAIRDGAVTLRYRSYQIVCPIRLGQPLKPALPALVP